MPSVDRQTFEDSLGAIAQLKVFEDSGCRLLCSSFGRRVFLVCVEEEALSGHPRLFRVLRVSFRFLIPSGGVVNFDRLLVLFVG